MRIIPNQSEKRFVSRLMKNGQKPIQLNLINFETSIQMNPNQSETEFSIRFNSNESKVEMIRIDSDWKFDSDQSGNGFIQIDVDWKLGFGLVRNHSDWCLGINRIPSDWFLTVFHQTRYKTFFGLVRKMVLKKRNADPLVSAKESTHKM